MGHIKIIPLQHQLDTSIGNIAKDYNVPDHITYITTVSPTTDKDNNYIFDGCSYTLIGMEYSSHKWGYQCAFSFGSTTGKIPGIKFRGLLNGTWNDWKGIITDSNYNIETYRDTDLDSITKNGIHWVWITNANEDSLNYPENSINGWLQVINTTNDVIKQIFWRYGKKNTTGNVFYTRTLYADGWSDWVKFTGTLV